MYTPKGLLQIDYVSVRCGSVNVWLKIIHENTRLHVGSRVWFIRFAGCL